jgi:predicted enzyme related to lactoylglutathione lyase
MKIRTVYFKVRNLDQCVKFWSELLEIQPRTSSPHWAQFRIRDINLGLLPLEPKGERPSCVPVFEFPDDVIQAKISRAKAMGASVILEGKDHPDYPNTAAVLQDPEGNEFEFTNYHG